MCFPIESWRESREQARIVYGGRLGPDLWKGTGRERNYFTLAAKGEDVVRRVTPKCGRCSGIKNLSGSSSE
jgi:hypothetical protein